MLDQNEGGLEIRRAENDQAENYYALGQNKRKHVVELRVIEVSLHCRKFVSHIQIQTSVRMIEGEQAAVEEPPEHEGPTGAVPEPCQSHNDNEDECQLHWCRCEAA